MPTSTASSKVASLPPFSDNHAPGLALGASTYPATRDIRTMTRSNVVSFNKHKVRKEMEDIERKFDEVDALIPDEEFLEIQNIYAGHAVDMIFDRLGATSINVLRQYINVCGGELFEKALDEALDSAKGDANA
jgi:hypothetical protein